MRRREHAPLLAAGSADATLTSFRLFTEAELISSYQYHDNIEDKKE